MKSLSSLPAGLLTAYYRNQNDLVKSNVHKALKVFDKTLNKNIAEPPKQLSYDNFSN